MYKLDCISRSHVLSVINNKAIACIRVYKAAVYLHFACLYESVDVLHSYSLVQRFTVAKAFEITHPGVHPGNSEVRQKIFFTPITCLVVCLTGTTKQNWGKIVEWR